MSKVRVVAENVNPKELDPRKLTTDCLLVFRKDGSTDMVRSYRKVEVFDLYYDLGIKLTQIECAGGTRNPKLQEPDFS
jgi:hypothetical protein